MSAERKATLRQRIRHQYSENRLSGDETPEIASRLSSKLVELVSLLAKLRSEDQAANPHDGTLRSLLATHQKVISAALPLPVNRNVSAITPHPNTHGFALCCGYRFALIDTIQRLRTVLGKVNSDVPISASDRDLIDAC